MRRRRPWTVLVCACAWAWAGVASAQPRGRPGNAPNAAAPGTSRGAQAPPVAPEQTVTSACGIPGQEATCARVGRLLRLAAAEASTGTCEGVAVAERACATLQGFVDDLCRLSGARVHAEGNAGQSAVAAADGALSNRAEVVRLHAEILAARRFCAGVLAAGARARGETAPARGTACGAERDEAADDMGVVENAVAPVTFGAAMEQAEVGLRACASSRQEVTDALEAPIAEASAAGAPRSGGAGPSGPEIRASAATARRPWWRPVGIEIAAGGAVPVTEGARAAVTQGVWHARVGVGFRAGPVELGVHGMFLAGGGETFYWDYNRPQVVLGGGVLLTGAYAWRWERFGLRLGAEVGWLHLRRVVTAESFSSAKEGDTVFAGLFVRPEYALWRSGTGASLALFADAGADHVALGWRDGDLIENLYVRVQAGVSYAF